MTPLTEKLEELLLELQRVDERLRAVYRLLADAPDLADQHADEIRDLHATRRRHAEGLGFALLAERRAQAERPATNGIEPVAVVENDESQEEMALSEPPEPPASADAIDDWKRVASERGVGQASYSDSFAVTWERVLGDLMLRLGSPRDLDIELAEEVDALDTIGVPPLIAQWSVLPRDLQQVWLAMLVARTRAVQDTPGMPPSQRARVKTIFSRYRPWSAEYRPGHVHGLRLDHVPVHRTWTEDARQFWQLLDARLDAAAPKVSAAAGAAKKKRKASDADDLDDEKTVRTIDPAWPLWSLVRGRRALVVGGDPREPNRKRLEALFELGSLEWPEIDGPRKVDAIVARIKRRTVDLVVVLRGFVDHKQSEPIVAAAKESGIAWAMADGYGATSIKLALERYLLAGAERAAAPSS